MNAISWATIGIPCGPEDNRVGGELVRTRVCRLPGSFLRDGCTDTAEGCQPYKLNQQTLVGGNSGSNPPDAGGRAQDTVAISNLRSRPPRKALPHRPLRILHQLP